jgi:hypothetical protein
MSKPRELPFYRVVPLATLEAFERGLHVREMEDKWETRFSNGYVDFHRAFAAEPTYRVFVRVGSESVEVGPLLRITSGLTQEDDEADMAMVEFLIARLRGSSPYEESDVFFRSDLRRWSQSIVDRFRARKSRRRRRRRATG